MINVRIFMYRHLNVKRITFIILIIVVVVPSSRSIDSKLLKHKTQQKKVSNDASPAQSTQSQLTRDSFNVHT